MKNTQTKPEVNKVSRDLPYTVTQRRNGPKVWWIQDGNRIDADTRVSVVMDHGTH